MRWLPAAAGPGEAHRYELVGRNDACQQVITTLKPFQTAVWNDSIVYWQISQSIDPAQFSHDSILYCDIVRNTN
jgi:hypothetical protein